MLSCSAAGSLEISVWVDTGTRGHIEIGSFQKRAHVTPIGLEEFTLRCPEYQARCRYHCSAPDLGYHNRRTGQLGFRRQSEGTAAIGLLYDTISNTSSQVDIFRCQV